MEFFLCKRVAHSADPGPILPNLEPFQDFIAVIVICKNKEDPIKMEELECSQDFPHYNPIGVICCHRNQSSDPIWPKT